MIGDTDICRTLPTIARRPFENIPVGTFRAVWHVGKVLGGRAIDFANIHATDIGVHYSSIGNFATRDTAIF